MVATGKVHFGTLSQFTEESWRVGINNKLMGQVNLVMEGLQYINDNGSFTLVSGVLNQDPIEFGASAAMVNGGIEGFVVGAAIEMPRGIRLNVVSPNVVQESMDKYAPYFPGAVPVAAADVAQAYKKSLLGLQTGRIFTVW